MPSLASSSSRCASACVSLLHELFSLKLCTSDSLRISTETSNSFLTQFDQP
uniref:Uncharacterized protein n=1 Tax=Arundo donax TaxID=35708 RepID=A0A0A9GUA9_ARUDO